MIENVYNIFGFVGSLVVALGIFFFFIFWMAGVAGICQEKENGKKQYIFLLIAILIPIYPVLWIIWDMIEQKRELGRL